MTTIRTDITGSRTAGDTLNYWIGTPRWRRRRWPRYPLETWTTGRS